MHPFVQKHKEHSKEVLDLIMFLVDDDERWKEICIKEGLCTRHTKRLYVNVYKTKNEYLGVTHYVAYVTNGRNQILIHEGLLEGDIPLILKYIKMFYKEKEE